jgi:diguanylate cyclase (GGDEF)-like protein
MHNYPSTPKQIWKRIPLSAKMLGLTLVAGLAVWLLLDHVQSRELRQAFLEQLSWELEEHAREDRILFDQKIQDLQRVAKLIVLQKDFLDFVTTQEWHNTHETPSGDPPHLGHHHDIPAWMPRASVLRGFFYARHALLIDTRGHVREIYHHQAHDEKTDDVATTLLEPGMLLHKLSHNQVYMTAIDGTPYALASQGFSDAQGRPLGTLMLSTPIDSEFLATAQHYQYAPDSLIALTEPGTGLIVSSSDPEVLPAGTLLSELGDRYLTIGKSFFDYGASDLELQFTSLLPTETAYRQANEILGKSSQQRMLLTFILVICSVILTMWIARRVKHLTQEVVDFSEKSLGIQALHNRQGDELEILNNQFQHLSEEIINTREDLQEESRAKEEMKHMAYHDPLTRLPNRILLLDRLSQAITLARREQQKIAVLFLDLDGFKEINDSRGHEAGDAVLREVAGRLTACVRHSDTVSRLGGDEFTLILQEIKDYEAVLPIADKILSALAQPIRFQNSINRITASIGIALFPDDSSQAHELLKRADAAMYHAKHQGKNSYARYRHGMSEALP